MNKIIVTQTGGYSGKENYPNSIEESVATNVATLLYNIGKDDDLNQTLTYGVDTTDNNRPVTSIKGSIKVPATYSDYLEYFDIKYPELKISATTTYIYFEDPKVEQYLIGGGISSDGVGISMADAEVAEIGNLLKDKTDITSFNSFKYFKKCNINPGNYNYFYGCNNLTSIDLSKLEVGTPGEFRVSLDSNNQSRGLTGNLNLPLLRSLQNGMFHGTAITSISNLGSIASIPQECFQLCKNLESVILPEQCISIGKQSFYNCSVLISLQGFEKLQSVGESAFSSCPLTSINLTTLGPLEIQSLGTTAFNRVQFEGVLDIPKLTTCGNAAFFRCENITQIKNLGILSSIPNNFIKQETNNSRLQSVKLPYECSSLGSESFRNNLLLTSVQKHSKSYTTDSSLNYPMYQEGETPTYTNLGSQADIPITNFGARCFHGCNLLQLSQTDIQYATSIGDYAFYKTLLAGNITLNRLTSVGQGAFEQTNIQQLDLSGSSINLVPNSLCYKCLILTSVALPSGITSIGNNAFYQCSNLTSINIPSSVTNLGSCAFRECSSLVSLDLSNILFSTSSIFSSNGEFLNCSSLTTLGVTSFTGITKLGRRSFVNCSSLTGTLSFPDVTEVECDGNDGGMFNSSSLSKIVLGHVETLNGTSWPQGDRGLASGCTNLKIADLGDSLISIGQGNFRGDTNLKAVIIRNTTPPTINNSPISWSLLFGNSDTILYVPASAVSTYLSATWFSTYGDANHIKSIENDYNESQILGS